MEDIISQLRPTTVPAGYICHPWKPGWCSVLRGEVPLVLLSCIALFRARGELYRQDEISPFSDGLHTPDQAATISRSSFLCTPICS